jgi:hypothetical protein
MGRGQYNDEEREQWVLKDEGLYDLQRRSVKWTVHWIRETRQLIDEVIDQVMIAQKLAHDLQYGG